MSQKKNEKNSKQVINLEWKYIISGYDASTDRAEKNWDIRLPLVIAIVCTFLYWKAGKVILALEGLSDILPTVISLLIGFTVMFITVLLTNDSKHMQQLRDEETDKKFFQKKINLYQKLLIQFSQLLLSEIVLLLTVFVYLFLKGLNIPQVIALLLLVLQIYLVLHVLLSILRGMTNLYFSFFNDPDDIDNTDDFEDMYI